MNFKHLIQDRMETLYANNAAHEDEWDDTLEEFEYFLLRDVETYMYPDEHTHLAQTLTKDDIIDVLQRTIDNVEKWSKPVTPELKLIYVIEDCGDGSQVPRYFATEEDAEQFIENCEKCGYYGPIPEDVEVDYFDVIEDGVLKPRYGGFTEVDKNL